jgi:hypothetical protein
MGMQDIKVPVLIKAITQKGSDPILFLHSST